MGFFDKLFNKRSGSKIKIKFFSEKETVDEQEQFLISEEDSYLKKAPKSSKAQDVQVNITAKNLQGISAESKSDVTKTVTKKSQPKVSEHKKVKLPSEKKKTATAKNKTAVTNKKTVPVSEADRDPDEAGAVTVTEGKATRNGKFDIKKAKDGRYFFSLYASNYAVIAYSQIYSSSSAAMNGIKSIIANAGKTPIEDTTLKTPKTYPFPKWEIYIDRAGEYRFRLYAQNGQCVCHSAHGYSTKSGCKGGIDSIGRFASDAAKIDKTYLK